MEKDLNDSVVNNSFLKESESDKSFVGKVKSIISNTPLSKWFRKQDDRPVVRRRDEVFEDDDLSEIQPPSKRLRLPSENEENKYNHVYFKETDVSATNVSKNVLYKVPEPVAGPSGIKSHKLLGNSVNVSASCARNTFNSELLNGHSDSEESTSGYSSVARIGSKEQVCESQESSKQASPDQTSPSNSRSLFHKSSVRPNRSLFADRSLSPHMNTSLSSRRPNFNASTFGSPNFVDKTISTRKIMDSPFYNGKTIYGGASAYGRALGRTSRDLKSSLRNSVAIKPVNKSPENGNLVLGKTARRILDTIEQYGTPVNDAKKIPVVSRKWRQDGLLTKYTGANPYIIRETKGPSNKELQVPTVSDLLRMKARLQESTETVRQLAATSKSDLNTEYYKIPTKEDEKEKHTGKIKAKVTSVRPKHPNNEPANEVNLPPVSLPITTLPKFDFVIPPPQQQNKNTSSKTTQQTNTKSTPQAPVKTIQTEINVQIEKKTTTSTVVEYKFSDPLVVAENMKSLVAINNFKFSEPPTCTKNKNVSLNFKMPENKLPNLVPNKKTLDSCVKTAKTLKTGSVMDVLGKKEEKDSLLEKFKPAQGTWECSVCMIRNQPDKTRCAACETPKTEPSKPPEPKNTFGSQFKLPSDKWQCNTCLVQNINLDSKCIGCSTRRPNSVTEKNPVTSIVSGFGDKFKPSGDTWECNTCMLPNKNHLTKCAACETPNPKASSTGVPVSSFNKSEPSNGITNKQTGFGMAFKAKADEWECGTCMVRNKESNTKCQCCETPNPKSVSSSNPSIGIPAEKKPISSFNFGIDKAAATSFSFGIPSTATVSLPNTNAQTTSIFGGNSKPLTTAPVNFSFGIPASTQDKTKTTETISSEPPAEPSKPNTTAPVLSTSITILKPQEKLPEKVNSTPAEFKFGATSAVIPIPDKKDSNTLNTDAPKSMGNTTNNASIFGVKPVATNGDVPSLFSKPETTVTATPAVTSAGVFAFGTKPAAVAAPLIPSTQSSQPEPKKPMFKFGSAAANTTFSSGNSVTTTLNNGFGNTNTPSFGMSNTSSFDKPTTNSTEVKPFTFGGTAAKETSEPASKVSMFSFGQSAPAVVAATTAAPKAGFNFGSTTTPSFNFTGNKTEAPTFNATPASGNMFGASSNSGGQNGTFNFGNIASSNNSQKAGFSFGAAVNTAGSGTQPGFNFGASAPTFAPPSGGFNFSAAPPAFNATAKPSFNFTEGNVTAFSAQPSADGGMAAPRKIKRAVRRTQR